MLLLRRFGLEQNNSQAQRACQVLLSGGYQNGGRISFAGNSERIDLGVTGMVLSILAYFGCADDRIHTIAETLVSQQKPDGRWEPWPGNDRMKYTFGGTLLILEGLHEYEKQYPQRAGLVIAAQRSGREFLLRHRLFMIGVADEKPIDASILLFSFPPRWHYDILVALDYFRDCQAERDERLGDAIGLLKKKRNTEGSWNLQNRHAGKTFFEMEEIGKPSRWNTLRGLQVLKWWQDYT